LCRPASLLIIEEHRTAAEEGQGIRDEGLGTREEGKGIRDKGLGILGIRLQGKGKSAEFAVDSQFRECLSANSRS
jgi:hypothetical protein